MKKVFLTWAITLFAMQIFAQVTVTGKVQLKGWDTVQPLKVKFNDVNHTFIDSTFTDLEGNYSIKLPKNDYGVNFYYPDNQFALYGYFSSNDTVLSDVVLPYRSSKNKNIKVSYNGKTDSTGFELYFANNIEGDTGTFRAQATTNSKGIFNFDSISGRTKVYVNYKGGLIKAIDNYDFNDIVIDELKISGKVIVTNKPYEANTSINYYNRVFPYNSGQIWVDSLTNFESSQLVAGNYDFTYYYNYRFLGKDSNVVINKSTDLGIKTFTYKKESIRITGVIMYQDFSNASGLTVQAHLISDTVKYYATTDNWGFYSFNVPEGDYFVEVFYNDSLKTIGRNYISFNQNALGTYFLYKKSVQDTVSKYYNISGKVNVANAKVEFYNPSLNVYYTTYADNNGNYTNYLRESSYNITFSAPGYENYATYLFLTSNLSGLNINLKNVSNVNYYTISGQVNVGKAKIVFYNTNLKTYDSTFADASGKYSKLLQSGMYQITYSAFGYEDYVYNSYLNYDNVIGANLTIIKGEVILNGYAKNENGDSVLVFVNNNYVAKVNGNFSIKAPKGYISINFIAKRFETKYLNYSSIVTESYNIDSVIFKKSNLQTHKLINTDGSSSLGYKVALYKTSNIFDTVATNAAGEFLYELKNNQAYNVYILKDNKQIYFVTFTNVDSTGFKLYLGKGTLPKNNYTFDAPIIIYDSLEILSGTKIDFSMFKNKYYFTNGGYWGYPSLISVGGKLKMIGKENDSISINGWNKNNTDGKAWVTNRNVPIIYLDSLYSGFQSKYVKLSNGSGGIVGYYKSSSSISNTSIENCIQAIDLKLNIETNINLLENISIKNCDQGMSFRPVENIYNPNKIRSKINIKNNHIEAKNVAVYLYNLYANISCNYINAWYGVRLFSSDSTVVKNNVIKSNGTDGSKGIELNSEGKNIIENNSIIGFRTGINHEYYSADLPNHVISKNTFLNNDTSIFINNMFGGQGGISHQTDINSNVFANNKVGVLSYGNQSFAKPLTNNLFYKNTSNFVGITNPTIKADSTDDNGNIYKNPLLVSNDLPLVKATSPVYQNGYTIGFVPSTSCLDAYISNPADTLSIAGVAHIGTAKLPKAYIVAYNLDLSRSYLTLSNDSGAFEFKNLPAGRYKIKAVSTLEDYETTFYPNKTDSLKANTLTLTGKITEVDIRLAVVAGLDNDKLNKFVVYPNPFHHVLHLNLENYLQKNVKATLVDSYGAETLVFEGVITDKELSFNSSDLTQGVYLLKITADDEQKVVKLFKR